MRSFLRMVWKPLYTKNSRGESGKYILTPRICLSYCSCSCCVTEKSHASYIINVRFVSHLAWAPEGREGQVKRPEGPSAFTNINIWNNINTVFFFFFSFCLISCTKFHKCLYLKQLRYGAGPVDEKCPNSTGGATVGWVSLIFWSFVVGWTLLNYWDEFFLFIRNTKLFLFIGNCIQS